MASWKNVGLRNQVRGRISRKVLSVLFFSTFKTKTNYIFVHYKVMFFT